jgi:hypothetical protein
MNLSPVEAIKRINEAVTVEMLVRRTKCCTGCHRKLLGVGTSRESDQHGDHHGVGNKQTANCHQSSLLP